MIIDPKTHEVRAKLVLFGLPHSGKHQILENWSSDIHELSEILKRHERSLSELPLALHYHQAEKVPGFQAQLLSDYLGVPRNTVPEVMTRSDDSSPLSASLALLLQQVIKLAEADLPQDEKGKQGEQDAAAKTPSPPPSQLAGAEAT